MLAITNARIRLWSPPAALLQLPIVTSPNDVATFKVAVSDPSGLPFTCEPFDWNNAGPWLSSVR